MSMQELELTAGYDAGYVESDELELEEDLRQQQREWRAEHHPRGLSSLSSRFRWQHRR